MAWQRPPSAPATLKLNPIMKNTLFFLLPTLLLGAASLASAGEGAAPDTLSDYLEDALAHDASLAAARLRWESLQARIPASGTLPDPELAYGYFFSPVETRVGAMNQQFGLFQKIPWPARLSEQRHLAEADAEVVYYDYLATLRERVAAAKAAWIHLAAVEAQIAILNQQWLLLEEALRTLDSRFTAGRGNLADRSLMRQQLTQLEARRLSLDGAREAAQAAVRRFVAEDKGDYTPSLAAITAHRLPALESLSQALLANSERLLARSAEVAAAERARQVARLEGYPDITLGLEYTQVNPNIFANPPDNGQDAVMGSIRISLPIWRSKYEALEKGAGYALSAARERQRGLRDDLLQQIRQHYARAEALEGQLRLYDTQLLPQTRETFEATLAGFGSGQQDALRWIEAQRDLLDAEMGRVMLESESLLALVEIERIGAIELIRSRARQ